ncbi:hypothetical protein F511_35256 [Dorcoceras hygrometricum]|uniref:RIN4 pathogenic type III effector avirulence factor Avr cleavage site domain-containing protein n=1 Tax=Dorcoceras hygrometricum TaxID=472368 RepID=A0A2Z7DIT6_9LAMI|nr:hypothetical protein F511_35256 [Dorcoceras hygrometricum]
MTSHAKGGALPKFGEWDVNNPASADGFTVIFAKARDDKKATGTAASIPQAQPTNPIMPQPHQDYAHYHHQKVLGDIFVSESLAQFGEERILERLRVKGSSGLLGWPCELLAVGCVLEVRTPNSGIRAWFRSGTRSVVVVRPVLSIRQYLNLVLCEKVPIGRITLSHISLLSSTTLGGRSCQAH